MFSITVPVMTPLAAKTNRYKKFGRKMKEQRQDDLSRIKDKVGDIARDEQRRVKEIFKEHQNFFKSKTKSKSKPKSIDFYEK